MALIVILCPDEKSVVIYSLDNLYPLATYEAYEMRLQVYLDFNNMFQHPALFYCLEV